MISAAPRMARATPTEEPVTERDKRRSRRWSPADDVAGEDEEARPGTEREPRVGVEAGQHVQALHVLVEKNERNDEHPRHHREPSAAVEPGENQGQIVEAQERELLLHQRM